MYTDGACSNNGKSNAKAGFGVWFGENDERNISESFTGTQTNNAAELLGIIKALTILKTEIMELLTIENSNEIYITYYP